MTIYWVLLETSAISYLPSPAMLPSHRAGTKSIKSHALIRRWSNATRPSNDNATGGVPRTEPEKTAAIPPLGCRYAVQEESNTPLPHFESRGSPTRDIARIWSAHLRILALLGFH
jgi:hypothetical protein